MAFPMGEFLNRAADAVLGRERSTGGQVSLTFQIIGGLPLAVFFAYSVPAALEPGRGHLLPGPLAVLGILLFPFATLLYAGGYLMHIFRVRQRGPSPISPTDRAILLAPALIPSLLVAGIVVRTLLR